MLKGKSISELSHELERRQALKRDYVMDTHMLTLNTSDELSVRDFEQPIATTIDDHAHGQIATWAGIPKKYYDKMRRDSFPLLTTNVNHWFHASGEPTRRMIRTMDGRCRAFLSDRYRRIDNEQVAQGALQTLLGMGNGEMEVLSADVTDSKLYIQACFPRLEGEVTKGDPVRGGLIISNSEIGQGQLVIQPIVYRLVCMNGMVVPSNIDAPGLTRRHVGRKAVDADEDYSIYRDETVQADDRVLQMKMRDTIHNMADQQRFQDVLRAMRRASDSEPVKDPQKAVEEASSVVELPSTYQCGVLESLIRNGDYSMWGMANAITGQAHQAESYDDAVELEKLGGKVISLDAKQWQRIAEAA